MVETHGLHGPWSNLLAGGFYYMGDHIGSLVKSYQAVYKEF